MVPWNRCNHQNGAARIGSHGTRRWGHHDEACNVPVDRRGTPRICHLVADKFGVANCQTVAPPALGNMPQGRAAAPEGTVAAQSSQAFRRQSAKAAAAAHANRKARSCRKSHRHCSTTCTRARCSSSTTTADAGRSPRLAKSPYSFAANPGAVRARY